MSVAREAARVPAFRSLLYREPRLYDLVFPDAGDTIATMVHAAIDRYGPAAPRSILDVGCGTGRHLEVLARTIPECCGVDLLDSNIGYARSVRPGITFHVGDTQPHAQPLLRAVGARREGREVVRRGVLGRAAFPATR